MKKLERYKHHFSDYACTDEDVAELEAEHARLEAINAELLEALEEIRDVTDGRKSTYIGADWAFSIARAAITKAKGG